MKIKRLGELDDRSDTDIALAALDEADEVSMHVRPLGELLLRIAPRLAQSAKICAQNSQVVVPFHTQTVVQRCTLFYIQSVLFAIERHDLRLDWR